LLKHDRNNPEKWEITGRRLLLFWVRDAGQSEQLRAVALKANTLRKAWEAARDQGSEEERLDALWPYFWSEQGYFSRN
jgi:hypothetical protein